MNIEKTKLRQKLRRKRSQAFDFDKCEGALAGQALADMAGRLVTEYPPTKVAGYIPMGCEIDPRPLMMKFLEYGAELYLPEVVERGQPLRFRRWVPGDMLISGMLGTLQPPAEQPVGEPDFIIVPLLGIDNSGVRLGQGGGFYDRTLPQLATLGARAFGVAFDTQMIDELPREPHDQLLDGVITPTCCKLWDDDRNVRYLAQK